MSAATSSPPPGARHDRTGHAKLMAITLRATASGRASGGGGLVDGRVEAGAGRPGPTARWRDQRSSRPGGERRGIAEMVIVHGDCREIGVRDGRDAMVRRGHPRRVRRRARGPNWCRRGSILAGRVGLQAADAGDPLDLRGPGGLLVRVGQQRRRPSRTTTGTSRSPSCSRQRPSRSGPRSARWRPRRNRRSGWTVCVAMVAPFILVNGCASRLAMRMLAQQMSDVNSVSDILSRYEEGCTSRCASPPASTGLDRRRSDRCGGAPMRRGARGALRCDRALRSATHPPQPARSRIARRRRR